jgi:hypothetical protein
MRTVPADGDERRSHLLVLVAGLATVVAAAWLVRSHWFYADDWTFLTRAGADDLHLLVQPANGHWMGATTLVFTVVRAVAGLGSYVPYALPAILAHVGTALLLWRWQRRDGVTPWVAAGLAVVLLVYGAAGENLFFAVNVGFNLSLVLGLAFVLLVDVRPAERGRGRLALAAAVGLLAVPTSTTGPVIVAGAAAWLAWRRDTAGVLAASPALVVYGGWVLLSGGGAGLPGGDPADVATFVAALVVTAAGRLLGSGTVTLGSVLLVAVVVPAVVTTRRGRGGAVPRPTTWMLALAGLAVAGATALARVQYGVETWRSPRYAYVVAALLVPILGVALDRVVRSGRFGTRVVAAGLPVVVAVNALGLYDAHRSEVDLEQHLRLRWTAAAQLLDEGVEPVAVNVDRYWAPNLHADHLEALVAEGAFPLPREPVGDPWRLEAHVELRSVLHGPMPYEALVRADLGGRQDGEGCVVLAPGEDLDVVVTGPTGVALAPHGPTLARVRTTTADGRTVALERVLALRAPFPRVAWIDGPGPATATLSLDGGGRVCPVADQDVARFADTEPS